MPLTMRTKHSLVANDYTLTEVAENALMDNDKKLNDALSLISGLVVSTMHSNEELKQRLLDAWRISK